MLKHSGHCGKVEPGIGSGLFVFVGLGPRLNLSHIQVIVHGPWSVIDVHKIEINQNVRVFRLKVCREFQIHRLGLKS